MSGTNVLRISVFCLTIAGSAILVGNSVAPARSVRSKALFLDPEVIDFVRPGLVLQITGASIASNGTITAQFSITDPAGLPLDRTGVNTPGAVSVSFIAAVLPNGQNDYVNYTGKPATGAVSGTVIQGSADSGGTFTQTGNGTYSYTFKTLAPSGFDGTATHTIGAYATRDLTSFSLGTYTADTVFNFVPNGSAVAHVHNEINSQTCNKCHDPLAEHGGPRHSIPLCILCHNPSLVDPNTGNSLDMKVFIHKIHMGSSLPSVIAGTPYEIVGFENMVFNFSGVVFPAQAQNCTFCHEGALAAPPNSGQPGQGGDGAPANSTSLQNGNPAPENAGATTGTGTALADPAGAACGTAGNPGCNPDLFKWPPQQANNFLQFPNRVACGSCHDNVNFVTGANHPGGVQLNDNLCSSCHVPQGTQSFDASIVGAHTIPQFAPELPGVVFTIVSVTGGTAGTSPTVTFTIHDKSGNVLTPAQMSDLSLVMAGPTGDYQNEVSESATKASGTNGTYTYTFTNKVPAGAKGTFSVGIEGYRNVTLFTGTPQQQTIRDVGFNPVANFSVDGSAVAPHPVEISQPQCNACHFAISPHGTIRQNVQYCLLCHNPTATDSSLRPAADNPPQGIDFPVLIHALHLGNQGTASFAAPNGEAAQFLPFIIYGFGGSVNNFSTLEFPGTLNHCDKCHTNSSQELPLPATRIAVTDPRAFINPTPPTTAACTACHISEAASSHALSNTTSLGEACEVCHGPNGQFSVDSVHADTN